MKVKPGIVRSIIEDGELEGFTYTLVIEINEGCKFHLECLTSIPNAIDAKTAMRNAVAQINNSIDDEKRLSYLSAIEHFAQFTSNSVPANRVPEPGYMG